MRIFSEQRELIQSARKYVEDKVGTLEKDVKHCLLLQSQSTPNAPAPFPALLFCFAIIDLLGSLHSGNARAVSGISERSRKYMQKFMHYTSEQSRLIQEVFRHKLVHLAQPRTVIKHNDQNITWFEHHNNPSKHLRIDKLSSKERIVVDYLPFEIEVDHIFNISIMDLVDDIKKSVISPNGYLATLERTPDLQDRFEQAIIQIYECEK